MYLSPEGTAEARHIPYTVHCISPIGRPFGTFNNLGPFPALKRRAIVTMSLRDKVGCDATPSEEERVSESSCAHKPKVSKKDV